MEPPISPEPAAASAAAGGDLYRTLARALLFAAGIVVVLWFAHAIRLALLLLILAMIITLVLNAPVTWLTRKGVSRGIASILVVLVLLGTSAGLGALVVPRLLQEIPTLLQEIPRMIDGLSQQVSDWMGGAPEVDRQLSQLIAWLQQGVGEIWRIGDTLAAGVLFAVFTFALSLYLVADPRPVLRWYVQSAPPHAREAAVRAFHRSSKMVVGWVLSNIILGGVKATAVFLFLTFTGVPGAILWSIPALFAALIPRLGFYITLIPPVIASLAVSWSAALWTAGFLFVFSEILGNFVAPRVQGEIMQLHAAYLLFMALAMGLAFGLVGVIIASPVAGFIKVFYEEFYLARQPHDPRLEDHVDRLMDGSLEGVRSMKEAMPG